MSAQERSPIAEGSSLRQRIPNQRAINSKFIERVRSLILANRTVRRALPVWGRLHIDRQLPFLFVYRRPSTREDAGTDRLIVGEASFLTAPSNRDLQPGLRELVASIAEVGVRLFGAFLVVEVWSSPPSDSTPPAYDFCVFEPEIADLAPTVETLIEELGKIRLGRKALSIASVTGSQSSPPGRSRLVSPLVAGVYSIGLEVKPSYRIAPGGPIYPAVLRSLHRKLTVAFKKAAFRFTRTLTTHRPKHFHALGRQAFSREAWEVDRKLAEVGDSFDFLLSVSPTNGRQAWAAFRRSGYEKTPRFLYPHLGFSPALLKRRLFAAPLERIEDPEINAIFRQKQDELDRQLTGLIDRGTSRFVHESVQIYGEAEPRLVELAETILDRTVSASHAAGAGGRVSAEVFAVQAAAEIDLYRRQAPLITSEVRILEDITGLMVSRGDLLVPRDLHIPESRVQALIQHEVGTHILTYLNGKAQPFRQLYLGLAGYDGLQEGIAVLSEHLVGGLTPGRLRLLAARVMAVKYLLDGASFIDTFRRLVHGHGFSSRSAFTLTMRVYRGGGLTKDAAYLRGLSALLGYLGSGGEFQPLLIGKIANEHVPVIEELLRRKALKAPPLRPGYLESPQSRKRLDAVKRGMTVLDLIERRKREK